MSLKRQVQRNMLKTAQGNNRIGDTWRKIKALDLEYEKQKKRKEKIEGAEEV